MYHDTVHAWNVKCATDAKPHIESKVSLCVQQHHGLYPCDHTAGLKEFVFTKRKTIHNVLLLLSVSKSTP